MLANQLNSPRQILALILADKQYLADVTTDAPRPFPPLQSRQAAILCSFFCVDITFASTLTCPIIVLDSYDAESVTNRICGKTSATLVIVPTTLVSQWVAEIKKCAPSLKVAKYVSADLIHGRCCRIHKQCKKSCEHRECQNKRCVGGHLEARLLAFVQSADIIISTYKLLRGKVSGKAKRVTKKCYLSRIHWRRIVLDEMQEVFGIRSN